MKCKYIYIDLFFYKIINKIEVFFGTCAALYGTSARKFFLTAVPQCPFPDAFTDPVLQAAGQAFDFVLIQFYNNPCGGSKANIVASYNGGWAAL